MQNFQWLQQTTQFNICNSFLLDRVNIISYRVKENNPKFNNKYMYLSDQLGTVFSVYSKGLRMRAILITGTLFYPIERLGIISSGYSKQLNFNKRGIYLSDGLSIASGDYSKPFFSFS